MTLSREAVLRKAAQVQLLIFDLDGVLTDGALYLAEDGSDLRRFHVHDGMGLVLLRDAGIKAAVISAGHSRAVPERLHRLGVEHCYLGQKDKELPFQALLQQYALQPEQTAYVGDDVVDLPVMLRAGLGITVANAHPLVRAQAGWITGQKGGNGAVREVCELILEGRGLLQQQLRRFLPQASE